ncbi:ubiquitin-conjugating enzyme E2 T-like isoform X2 [Hydractinia symbiolongicarpus]|uniref:ubiquitin-conjugating enzyme E2 T-like isoform X2 n=1 Tax=Hydractinia symbiolongicarpus TaxID=13093 RepID=UPI0025512457|nr:ubiquitin-conjugating enzyme E2 T-like isoform X2 [Hydractinia symbiolongicarpus]
MMSRAQIRMKQELQMLSNDPPPGIFCYSVDNKTTHLKAGIIGTSDTPFEGGLFMLDIVIPERYPFEPPLMKFITPIYHPNIDSNGRICLDLLKMPPKGDWKPALNISTLLKSIQLLMSNPNFDDPLMVDIANEFRSDKRFFRENAKLWTQKHAMEDITNTENKSRKRVSNEIEDPTVAKARMINDPNG